MKEKIKSLLSLFLLTTFIAVILALTIRGVPGNPSPREILTDLRSEGKPFELSPERGRYALVMSIVENNSLFFTREIAEFVLPDLGYIDGRFVSVFAPGVSFLALPLYVLGRSFNISQVFVFSVSGIFALFNVLLIRAIVNRITNNRFVSVVSGLTFLFATTAWSYSATLYQHHVISFLLLLSLYILSFKINIFSSLLISFLFGIGLFVAYPNIVFFVPILLLILSKHLKIKEVRRRITITVNLTLLFAVIGLFISLTPLFLYNNSVLGTPFRLSGTVQGIREMSINTDTNEIVPPAKRDIEKSAISFFKIERLPNGLSVLLASKDRGLLWFSPVILLGLLGIYPLYRKNKSLCYTLIGGIGSIVLLYGMWADPWGGWAFGPRYLIPAMAQLSILLGVAIVRFGRRLWFAVLYMVTLGYSILVNVAGALTTNQIPPSVEIDAARYPEMTYFHNFNLINQGKSGSFIYNMFLSDFIRLDYFMISLFGVVFAVIVANYLIFVKSVKPDTKT